MTNTQTPTPKHSKLKSILRALPIILTLTPQISHSAVVTELSSLNIGGILYDATIHISASPNSFNTVWDADGDIIFGEGDASLVDHAPMFMHDNNLALAAASTVIGVLGSLNTFDGSFDGILLPSIAWDGTFDTIGEQLIVYTDPNSTPGTDLLESKVYFPEDAQPTTHRWVSFELSATPVPLPPTMFMLVSGLLALVGFRKSSLNKA